jgi:hypothetical protein
MKRRPAIHVRKREWKTFLSSEHAKVDRPGGAGLAGSGGADRCGARHRPSGGDVPLSGGSPEASANSALQRRGVRIALVSVRSWPISRKEGAFLSFSPPAQKGAGIPSALRCRSDWMRRLSARPGCGPAVFIAGMAFLLVGSPVSARPAGAQAEAAQGSRRRCRRYRSP